MLYLDESNIMKKIQLTGKHSNIYITVDNDILETMSKHRWYESYCPIKDKIRYAIGYKKIDKKFRNILAHRYAAYLYGILTHWSIDIDPMQIDHINHNGLDNTRSNLRAVTNAENQRNQIKRKGVSSKYRGVYKEKKCKSWRTSIRVKNKFIYLGCFDNEINAAKAYDNEARKFGYLESSLNFPRENIQ